MRPPDAERLGVAEERQGRAHNSSSYVLVSHGDSQGVLMRALKTRNDGQAAKLRRGIHLRQQLD